MSASPESKPHSPAAAVSDHEPQVDLAEETARPPTPGADDNDDGQDEAAASATPAAQSAAGDDDDEDEDDADAVDSDEESILSEVDEAQFDDFDPENVDVEDRPQLAIDEDNLKLIGRHKRKRTEEDSERVQRKREGRREKKSRRLRDMEEGGDEGDSKARRRDRKKRDPTPEDEDLLDPATRRRRALDRAMDEAMKKPTKRRFRKADGIDLEQMADAEIEDMRKRMTHAAQLDAINRREGRPAMHKLKMLPEVVSLLNRNQYVNSLVDPEINLLEAVKFFLEPLDDGSLPAYNIQRDLMTALGKLPINKEALIASGIGKVIVFYTKSKRPEAGIKRMAERLLAEWTRPILQRSDDYSKRVYQEAEYDPRKVTARTTSAQASVAEARQRELLPPRLANRARAEITHTSYTIVPRPTMVQESKFARPLGASGEDRFRRMRARQIAAAKGSRR
ncbi:transcription factor SPN1 [Aspergillus clavatus NRRL 1]|uniref:Transcriptional elongation factor Iws1, putative n=1 Tax=Aspergillus clavatus (strain ATCC 1007 / CBS 513.65 / DSM 816 / NCTC 3887 / NRRL 1 / QM 1276 / 107) TaxID=344612 RepID=A1CPN5_ASPCL|nr:transcriptional elongation factor Iws1, putative [Aspergillus clavatus NRRL 1]EAW07606.1 transcriptional elongation factor Iws1, putative [Aspergillus clavatus NRRL 1]